MTTLILGGVAAVVALLQTTLLSSWTILGARPDLVLVVLTFAAHTQGVQRGQVTGFVVGIVEDVMGLAPLGFHGLVRLAHSAVVGFTHGSVEADRVVTPMVLVLGGQVVKFAAALLLATLLGTDGVQAGVFSLATIVEIVLTTVSAPLVFPFLRLVTSRVPRKGGFS